jgi:hypothetical protein
MLGALAQTDNALFTSFLLTRPNADHLRRAVTHAVLDLIVELSPRIAAFPNSEECRKQTGYTIKQMKELIEQCQKKQKTLNSRATFSHVTSAPELIDSHIPPQSEDSETAK